MEEEFDYFIEKKPENYIEIKSRDNLFTLFSSKNLKCYLKIPHTMVFDAGINYSYKKESQEFGCLILKKIMTTKY